MIAFEPLREQPCKLQSALFLCVKVIIFLTVQFPEHNVVFKTLKWNLHLTHNISAVHTGMGWTEMARLRTYHLEGSDSFNKYKNIIWYKRDDLGVPTVNAL